MMTPKFISRNDYLVNYTTREDAAPKDYWADGIHSKITSPTVYGLDQVKIVEERKSTSEMR